MAGNFVGSSSQDISIASLGAVAQGTFCCRFKSSTTGYMNILGFGVNGSTTFYGYLGIGGNLHPSWADESIGWVCVSSGGGAGDIAMYVRAGTDYYQDGNWHSVVVVIDGSDNRMYIDGVKQTMYFAFGAVNTANCFINTSSLDIVGFARRYYLGSPSYYTGLIDDARVYDSNKYFTDAEAKIYHEHQGNDGITTGLIGHWRMDEAASGTNISSIIDISGNGITGTATNNPTYIASPLEVV